MAGLSRARINNNKAVAQIDKKDNERYILGG